NPRPLMATSSALPVLFRPPCAWFFSVATTRTPVPRFSPVGATVSCEVAEPTCFTFWYSRSSNTARSFLKPVVFTLARLCEMTVMRVCCASSPVFAAHSAECMVRFLLNRLRALTHRQQPRGGGAVVFGGLHGAHLQVEAARQFDHVHQRIGDVDVAGLEHAGHQRGGGIGRRIAA